MQIFINLDGTLLDVRARYYAVYSDLLRQSGLRAFDPATYWSFKRLSLGESCIVARSASQGFIEDYLIEHADLIEDPAYLMLDELQPAVAEQLSHWSKNHDIYLATSRREFQPLIAQLEYTGIRQYFKDIVVSAGPGCQSCENKVASIKKYLQNSQDALLICDDEAGLLAAHKLDIYSMAVTDGRRTRQLLQQVKPGSVVNSFENINLEFWNSLTPVSTHTHSS